jgi:ferric-dicitrate binding protein FerR (iron transport regulator)
MTDSASDKPPAELWPLLSALVDGTISAADHERLEAMLRDDRAVRDAYRDFMQLESLLAWELAAPATGAETPPERPRPSRPAARHSRRPWRRSAAWLLPLALAAAAAAAVAVLPAIRSRPEPAAGPADAPLALLADSTDAEWADGLSLEPGAAVAAGPLRLVAGSAQLRFRSGAFVTLSGPAEIEVLDGNSLFLRSGRIIPYVPKSAKGFTVVSPTGEVIDLGTEFAVSVDADGRTDVHVIAGDVQLARGRVAEGTFLTMKQGFGGRVAAAAAAPEFTDTPLVFDDFSTNPPKLHWRDIDAGRMATIHDGQLAMPVEHRGRGASKQRSSRIVLEHDFSAMRGRRTAISFRGVLPEAGIAGVNRWLACVIDDGTGEPPLAMEPEAVLAALVSPHFQAAARIDGGNHRQTRVFSRDKDAIGPYQVFMTIDDTPAAHETYGGTVADVIVNGQSVIRRERIELPDRPRIGLQTYSSSTVRGRGEALVDDFSVSVSVEAPVIPPSVKPQVQ